MLLRDAGYRFTQTDPLYADPPQPNNDHPGPPQEHAIELAAAKAHSLRGQFAPGDMVLAADTICVGVDGKWIGHPADRDDARQMIRSFLNADHDVVTGVALMRGDEPFITFADTAVVRFGPLRDQQIEAYLDTDRWRGKAGGYNLTERLADGWPIRVTGDPATVVGLPMRRLVGELAKLDLRPEHT